MKQTVFDLVIYQANVIDGSGCEGVIQDVAILGDRIALMGDLSNAACVSSIQANGLTLAPGFIDVHTHDDIEVIRNPQMECKVSQGVTTVIVGNCGISASPVVLSSEPPDPMNLLGTQEEFSFPQFSDYVNAVSDAKPAVNVAALVGHTSIRNNVMDDLFRAATNEEIDKMCGQLRTALSQGALGLSSGLAYATAKNAPSSELEVLARELPVYNAIYATHLRTEFDGIADALGEAFQLGRNAGVSVQISHLKCAGKSNWGRSAEIIDLVEKHSKKQDISCDCYPYSASSSTLDLKQVTDDFDIFITWSTPHADMAGQTLADIAKQWGVSLLDAAKKLQPAGAVYYGMLEDDVRNILQYPQMMIGSDGLPCDPIPHPRLWGSFPRVLGHYSRELELFDLATAVKKMTSLPATRFSLKDRGLIRTGYFADLVLFDPLKINDAADFLAPVQAADGIDSVWVNGQLTYQQKTKTQAQSGQFLMHHTRG